MVFSTIHEWRGYINDLIGPEVSRNGLNLAQLRFARRGYQIQSQILHIPDRVGFFSPGPARLQVREGAIFAGLAICMGFFYIPYLVPVVFFMRLWGWPLWELVLGIASLTVAFLVGVWVLVCLDPRRAPDYDWSEADKRSN
ncbi:hypothetical protein F4804DRAFT_338421 [Jackrogersella minutella]|nr:hypothetical protein F4804DRAFT_338421 [Jackrogersella minutella]